MSAEINLKNDILYVSGDLTFATTPNLSEVGIEMLADLNKASFDLSDVSKSDNSAVALLLTWLRFANKNGKKAIFVNVPKQLQDLVKLSGLTELLLIQ